MDYVKPLKKLRGADHVKQRRPAEKHKRERARTSERERMQVAVGCGDGVVRLFSLAPRLTLKHAFATGDRPMCLALHKATGSILTSKKTRVEDGGVVRGRDEREKE